MLPLRKMSERKKSFQQKRPVSTATVPVIGRRSGSTTWTSVRTRPAPSTWAASSYSRGSVADETRVEKDRERHQQADVQSRIMPKYVPTRWQLAQRHVERDHAELERDDDPCDEEQVEPARERRLPPRERVGADRADAMSRTTLPDGDDEAVDRERPIVMFMLEVPSHICQ